MALGKKTGGRTKGAPNKTTKAYRTELTKAGLLPLEYMLAVLRDPEATEERKSWAAEKAAQFCHPRLTSIEGKLDITNHEAALEALK